jgi:K+-transporting ATPase KdpF subunit
LRWLFFSSPGGWRSFSSDYEGFRDVEERRSAPPSPWPRPRRDEPMLIVSAIIGVILLGYLLYALVKPEKLG